VILLGAFAIVVFVVWGLIALAVAPEPDE